MDERITRIRESERISHTRAYKKEVLYRSDSWLNRPIKAVREIMPMFAGYPELRLLDLGCGVGRNSIYIAQQFQNHCVIDCVDLLPIAIEKLLAYAQEQDLSSCINGICQTIEEYEIHPNSYDFIMAVSSLEHVDSHTSLVKKLLEIKQGTRENGIICLIMNTNVVEQDLKTKEQMEAQFELNYTSEALQALLNETFKDWKELKSTLTDQEYDIPRETFTSHLHTSVVTYVAQKY